MLWGNWTLLGRYTWKNKILHHFYSTCWCQKHHFTLRLLLGRMAIPSFHSRTWTMLQAPPTCAVRVGVAVSLALPPLPGSPTATAGVTSIFWWPEAGAEERGALRFITFLPELTQREHKSLIIWFFFVWLTMNLKRKANFPYGMYVDMSASVTGDECFFSNTTYDHF